MRLNHLRARNAYHQFRFHVERKTISSNRIPCIIRISFSSISIVWLFCSDKLLFVHFILRTGTFNEISIKKHERTSEEERKRSLKAKESKKRNENRFHIPKAYSLHRYNKVLCGWC